MKLRLLMFIILLPLLSQAQLAIPELWGMRVHDEAKVLSPGFTAQLERQLKQHEDSTSNQIAVLIVPSLQDEPIEDYTLRVAETWKLGRANNDNGVLLFIAINDRKIRIEVGEGLEGVLTDALSNQIIRNEIAPYFRQDNYEGGVKASIDAITKAIAGEYHQEVTKHEKRRSRGGSLFTILIILFIIIIMSRGRGGRGNRGGGWMSGTGYYGGGWSGRSGGGGWSGGGGFSGGGGGFSGGGSSGSW